MFHFTCFNVEDPDDPAVGLVNGEVTIPGNLLRREVFDPVVKFVNAYRARPRRVVDRIYQTCGMYEDLITPNRSMVSVFREAGMTVRYREARDGHN